MPVHLTGILLGLLTLAAAGVSACSGPEPEYGFCKGRSSPIANELFSPYTNWTVQWAPDGSHILFDYFEVFPENSQRLEVPDIYAVHVSGKPVKKVLDLPSRDLERHGVVDTTVFDLSADGASIAYAACARSEESLPGDDGDERLYSYEIFVSDFDGANVTRLTNNTYLDSLPAWSPDGESLAFISDPDRSIHSIEANFSGRGPTNIRKSTTRITIHDVATGESREIGLAKGYAAAPIRLEWSPGGDRIAFVVLEGERHPWNLAVYIVGADGTGLTRVSDAMSGPTWSPDGEAIAMVVPEGDDGEAFYTFAADGSNPVKVDSIVASDWLSGNSGSDLSSGNWYGSLSWSPDGSAILVERFRARGHGRPSVVPLGATGVEAGLAGASHAGSRAMTAGAGAGSILASPLNDSPALFYNSAWSPDGTQIAVRKEIAEFFDLEVVDLQGNVRKVVDWERSFR